METLIYSKIELKIISYSFVYSFSCEILFCLSDVIGKKYLNIYLDGVYLFLFKVGITGLIPLLIYDIICKCFDLGNYHGIIETIFSHNISKWLLLINLLFSIIFQLGVWIIIYNFTPCHFIILEALGDLFKLIFSLFDKSDDKYINFVVQEMITFAILYPVLIFAVLVFNEILILNFFRLNYNTTLYITKREKIDRIISDLTNNDNEEENEDNSEDSDGKNYIKSLI